jgi:hypothetical protein
MSDDIQTSHGDTESQSRNNGLFSVLSVAPLAPPAKAGVWQNRVR